MSNFNSDLIDEINFLRSNPRRYSKKILKYIEYFKDNVLYIPGSNAGIPTEEGPAAFKEAADALIKEERRNILEPSKGLCKLAENFLSEAQKDADNVGNIQPDVLIKKLGLGTLHGYVSRLFEFGGETPEQVIINIIVSDGDPSRSQRESLLNAGVKQIGVANGKHDMYGHLTTIIVATKFKSNDNSDDKGLLDGEYIPKDLEKVNDNEVDEDVERIEKIENIITEKGIKKKITKIIKYMKDGTKQIETYKEKAE